MSKGKSVWLAQEVLDWLDSLKVIPDQSYTSVLRELKKKEEKAKT